MQSIARLGLFLFSSLILLSCEQVEDLPLQDQGLTPPTNSSSSIHLNLINRSQDTNNSAFVLFQKNVAQSYEETAIAWRVVKNLGRNDNRAFEYSLAIGIAASDSYGNFTPALSASPGLSFQMIKGATGDVLKNAGMATSPKVVELHNSLATGAINAHIYRDGKLLAQTLNIVPGAKAEFEFIPHLFIGVASQLQEGEVMNSAVITDINTEINLLGLAGADIVVSGGGALPFEFQLENVEYQ